MQIEGLPHYSSSEIESKANKLLLYFSPTYFETVRATPLLAIVEFLNSKHGIVFQFDNILGFNNDNNRILGAYNPIKRVIIIDSSLKSDIHKFNFTLAHELGHLALHRNLKIKYDSQDENNEEETIIDYNSKKELKTDSDWMEWQANYYASALLMPKEIFKTALVFEQRNLGISRTGTIYVDNQSCNQQAFFQLINLLSQRFEVSKSAVEYRLQKLKLVDDKRKTFTSVSDILSGLGNDT